ncbi:isoleucine--tRNA ligase [Enterobacteriaceae endosymbiont of Donacia bicoloricornis]|uniref:isoleucine--tRNA ligase n=1 Tax=Enterobacteriaceae endosymbiont of Donacia bicoloricornis TaxID=2675772 RepID=UPI00144987AC|nr:isoleucine--tRNA ligase [Enterobacteriaceae endosymbiont of Donacia bicoloricornis]QJC37603.1 isoleucine--tRNA ligase [Enterobacteriaceae endosymbiont of Donacia bicoloricornis]
MKNKFNLNLPKTKFPMKACLTQKELIILKQWEKDNLYKKILKNKKNKKKFILHDGPPYANGNIHIGHAFNKILKDIIIKFKNMNGYSTSFIPGWDCHGLPIEQKVEKILKKKKKKISKKQFRIECRKYAFKQIKKQKKDFIRLGILADWLNPYLTMNFKTEANIVRTLGKIIKNNYLYKGKKPVHWCVKCLSSLAGAEIDYVKKKTLTCYVMFNIINTDFFQKKINMKIKNYNIAFLIWTTTPWTIPANRAIVLNPEIYYQLIKINKDIIILAKNLVNIIMDKKKIIKWEILLEIKGKFFKNILIKNPINNNISSIIIDNYVSEKSGTGIVHMAPNHGLDDYNICNKHKITCLKNIIDKKGFFKNGIHPQLDKINIFSSEKIIIKILIKKKALFLSDNYIHNYPYCWRHKIPIIYISTPQWFISIDKKNLRKLAKKLIKKVQWIPNWGYERMNLMLDKRPDWCISRQRTWGIPIPLFINKKTQKIHTNSLEFIEKIACMIEKKGIQAWWDLDIEKFLGQDAILYEKIIDVLDVWFDSGSTYDSVINQIKEFKNNKIDIYVEGNDQYRGWFISSLIISTAINNNIPYKTVIGHGFTVDNNGRKMSKSLGNIIKPQNIINTLGSDILRLWVASTDYTNEINISLDILKRTTETYRRIRNTVRFILSNLDQFIPEKNIVQKKNMLVLDKWIIHKTKIIQDNIIKYYNIYNIKNVIQEIMQFCSVDLGSIYFDIIKDRQYTFKKCSIERLSCQTSLYMILEALVRWIAPILSFTAHEIWNYIPGKRSKYIFTEKWYSKLFYLSSNDIMNYEYWNDIFIFKNEINKIIEYARNKKIIGSSLEANIIVYVNKNIYKKLIILGSELRFLLLVSNISFYYEEKTSINKLIQSFKIKKSKYLKCKRCWYYSKDINNNICNRCELNTIGNGEKRLFI